ncbi:MAG: AAA family ATPase, partial [Bacteroidota bacterium]
MMDPSTEDYLNFLSKAAHFPEQPSRVKIIQTHASIVALTDAFAYKLKKPVDFGFLDFSTLDNRHFYCQEELRLNRRLSQDIYLDIVPLYFDETKLSFENKPGRIVNYAVKMRRLREAGFLVNLIQDPQFPPHRLDTLILLLQKFYAAQSPRADKQHYGGQKNLKEMVEGNLSPLPDWEGFSIDSRTRKLISQEQRKFIQDQASLLDERVRRQKILEGHGDLRAEHIYYEGAQVQLFDCIEFSEALRYLDPLNELAFLYMDFCYRQRADLGDYLFQEMIPQLEAPTDQVKDLFKFYLVYRACVRGKVNSLKAQENEVDAETREISRKKAQGYFRLALRFSILGSEPHLILVLGGVASGKSTLARRISEMLGLHHLNSDVLRKDLAGQAQNKPTPSEKIAQVYSEEMTQKTYKLLQENGQNLLHREGAVVLDATYRNPELL